MARRIGALTSAIVVALLMSSCAASYDKLDEAVFYSGPVFILKVVRYEENLPFHYVGQSYRVQCQSPATAISAGGPTLDPGWHLVGNGSVGSSRSAAEIAERIRPEFHIVSDRSFVWVDEVRLIASEDACETIQGWDLASAPAHLRP